MLFMKYKHLVAFQLLAIQLLTTTLGRTDDVTVVVQGVEQNPILDEIITDKGEVPVDYEHNELLPEELDDGELEGGDHHIDWNYKNQNGWGQEYPECKGTKMRQSPINIITDKVTLEPKYKLEFVDYDQQVEFQLKNTHHSISVVPIPSVSIPTIKLTWLPGGMNEFELQEIHFHWGDGKNKGSEHEINAQRSAAEMHMVHYRKGVNKTEIGSIENSVVVIGVLIEPDSKEHQKLEGLVQYASQINGTDNEYICDEPQNLINLLPEHHQSFYTYAGSLTTPPCYEVVTWIIMSEPVYMSNDRLIELSNIERAGPGSSRRKINSNHREIQPLLDRPVYASFNSSETVSPIIIRGRDARFKKAFEEYWKKIKGVTISVRKAYITIRTARSKLVQQVQNETSQQ